MSKTTTDHAQGWAYALRVLMGYPAYAPGSHTLGFCASRTPADVAQVTGLARDMQRDLVYLEFAGTNMAAGPATVSLAVRQAIGVRWLSDCRVYAAHEAAPFELLAGDRSWSLGSLLVLTAAQLPPSSSRVAGEAMAKRRWQALAATMGQLQLTGSVLVGAGRRYADAVPVKGFREAA